MTRLPRGSHHHHRQLLRPQPPALAPVSSICRPLPVAAAINLQRRVTTRSPRSCANHAASCSRASLHASRTASTRRTRRTRTSSTPRTTRSLSPRYISTKTSRGRASCTLSLSLSPSLSLPPSLFHVRSPGRPPAFPRSRALLVVVVASRAPAEIFILRRLHAPSLSRPRWPLRSNVCVFYTIFFHTNLIKYTQCISNYIYNIYFITL